MTSTTSLTLRSPEDVLAAVPCLLGFQPADSVVMLTFGPGRTFHARVDLPPEPADDEEVVDVLVGAVSRHQVRQVLLVAFSDDDVTARRVLHRLEEALTDRGVEVVDVLRTDDERWFPLRPGRPDHLYDGVPYSVDAHPFAASAVFAGRVTHGSREELADSVVGSDAVAIEEVGAAALGAARRVGEWQRPAEARWLQQTVLAAVDDRRPFTIAEAGRLLVAILDLELRDVAWSTMTAATARDHVELWRDLVRRCPTELLAAPATLLAFAAWLSGHGALAWCALDRVNLVDPDYRMAGMVAAALQGALSPEIWEPIPSESLSALRGG